jgi:sugar/nucleoside kinase (ribokinase family)
MPALPREGELVAVDSMPIKVGGCAANVAVDLAKQGVGVEVIGCVGDDAAAGLVISRLAEANVGCERIIRTQGKPTSTTVILLVEGQDRRYVHAFGANSAFTVEHVDREWVRGLRIFYVGGLLAMPGIKVGPLAELLRFCREHDVATVVDVVVPKEYRGLVELEALLPQVDYFTPNSDEARQLTGEIEPENQLRALLARGAKTVIVTCGASGAVAGRDGKTWKSQAFPTSVVDPSGGGDAYTAGIITGILRGWEMERMLAYAAALGASAIRAVGTTDSVFTSSETEAFVALHPLPISVSKL